MSSGPRSNPRATVEHVDPVTQLPAPPGPESEPSGRYVSRVRGRTVQVWPEEDLDLPWENPGRHLRRAPIGSLGDEQLAELGYLIEVEVAGRVLRWRPGACVLLWSPRYRALVAIQGCRPGPRRATPGTGRAAAARRRWTGRDPDRERTIRVPGIRGVWSSLGRCVRTDYQSAKWGRSVPYTHDHGPGVRVYRYGGARPPWIWVIRGGQLRITADGIEG
jgi:hypothetical protein